MPRNLGEAYEFCVRYKSTVADGDAMRRQGADQDGGTGLSFYQNGSSSPIAGTDGIIHDEITSFDCNSVGHYANECPNRQPISDRNGNVKNTKDNDGNEDGPDELSN